MSWCSSEVGSKPSASHRRGSGSIPYRPFRIWGELEQDFSPITSGPPPPPDSIPSMRHTLILLMCHLCYINSATDSVFNNNASLWSRTHNALSFCLQEYSNVDHLPLRTTALTQLDGDIRERAHKLCCEYLRGAWKRTTAEDLVIRKVRYICAPHVITDLFFLKTKVTRTYFQASSVSEASLRISKFGGRGGPKRAGWISNCKKVKKVVPVHVINAYRGNRGIAHLILNFGTIWRWGVIITPRQLYSRKRTPVPF
jgi:hypothetical protein